MKFAVLILGVLLVIGALCLRVWRQMDHRADRAEMHRLRGLQPVEPALFSRQMVADLPDPARRFFNFAIAEGTSLHTVAEITMCGQFSMGSKDAPNYAPMRAVQILAAPEGFVWKMTSGSGLTRLSGSDSAGWTRFWLAGLVPVARFGGNPDHRRAAFGRYVAEAAFWTPAALLPETGTIWEAIDDHSTRYTVIHGDLEQSVELTVDEDGRPIRLVFQRWSNANADGVYRLQAFGGEVSRFREFDGFRIATHIEAGNQFGTDGYFPFFIADVTALRFPSSQAD